MRQLSDSLLVAQKKPSHIPYIKLEAFNKTSGVVRLNWTRLYTGSEDDYFHAVTMPGDGSLIRARITPITDSRKLYRQRVANPGPASDFSQWVYTDQYNAVVVACCSLGAEVSIFWIDGVNRKIQRIKSTDYGANWGSPELIDYSPTTAIYGIAAAYKANGDLALLFADQNTLYVKKYVSDNWQDKASWDKSTGDLSGVACVYNDDWNLLVTGKDSNGNFKLWSLIYGDGGEVAADSWSELKEFASAPSDADYEYSSCSISQPDVYRCFYIEKFAGTQSYNRPFWSHSVLDTKFVDNLWREPVPFDLSGGYGLAITYHGDYCWLTCPDGVWRASLAVQSLDLSDDVLSVRQEINQRSDKLVVELRNDGGQYGSPGQGDLAVLDTGCQIEFSPGYVTQAGNEVSSGQTFVLDGYEHTSLGGKASLVLYASVGWSQLVSWRARNQLRWNRTADEMSVKDILAFVLARVGLKLEVKSQSSVITGFYPDFTIHANNNGEAVIRRLLSFVPDVLFVEGAKAYIINPQSSDSSVYSYGSGHSILGGRYRQDAWEINRVQVEGYDTSMDSPIIVNCFEWAEITRLHDRLLLIDDQNLDTEAGAQARGEARLRQSEIESAHGVIRVPVNCGQQLYDVIDITDARSDLNSEKRRLIGLTLVYVPLRGEYEQRLLLAAV